MFFSGCVCVGGEGEREGWVYAYQCSVIAPGRWDVVGREVCVFGGRGWGGICRERELGVGGR